MSKDFSYLRHWITGEGYPADCPSRPVILECVPSRSGMSMAIYDRGERIFAVNGCGFDRVGTALGEFLEACFRPELSELVKRGAAKPFELGRVWSPVHGLTGLLVNAKGEFFAEGSAGFESMAEIARAIGLKVHQSESKAGTLLIISKKG